MFKFLTVFAFAMVLAFNASAQTVYPVPYGYVNFIKANPTLMFDGRETWKPDMGLLNSVNKNVNDSMTYVPESKDVWGVGSDCEDFAILKMKKLLGVGVPRGAMRLAITKVDGIGHAVLVVSDFFVMDNLSDEVKFIKDYPNGIQGWESGNGYWSYVVSARLNDILKN